MQKKTVFLMLGHSHMDKNLGFQTGCFKAKFETTSKEDRAGNIAK